VVGVGDQRARDLQQLREVGFSDAPTRHDARVRCAPSSRLTRGSSDGFATAATAARDDQESTMRSRRRTTPSRHETRRFRTCRRAPLRMPQCSGAAFRRCR
jgi:hypothetical protein